jgi:hypothetical protein
METQIQKDMDRIHGRGEFAVPAGSMHLSPAAAASIEMSQPGTVRMTPAGSAYLPMEAPAQPLDPAAALNPKRGSLTNPA